ncbi:sister chromatid cohesion protein DCC1 isoform X2 [Chelonus insularis]|uniref:sister chromatid cohesion protein DCC1 isoform X2 n=1 Tax=Chelonus insularis TaxID=460826 RepID=UPI00158DC6A6|nr:sister chromatid cohesion protein DCC1 isoform X2 [Chelonus insularis]
MSKTGSNDRTTKEIKVTLEAAKFKESDLKNLVQIIYSQSDPNDDIRLLELDKNMLKSIQEGHRLSFKGHQNDRAVLCTDDRTYIIEEAETSNSLLLCPGMKFTSEITTNNNEEITIKPIIAKGIFYTYLEASQCKPEVGKLLSLLESTSFKGPEYEKQMNKHNMYTWSELCCEIQASDEELRAAISEYMVVEMDGFYRLISFEFESKALTMMLDFMEENSWSLNQVNKEETYEALKELIPRPIFDMVFHKYAARNAVNSFFTYNIEKVCKFLAKVLLSGSPVNDFKLFMEAWRMGVPEGINPKLEYLHGIAVVVWNNEKARKEIVSFPESKLSENIADRFKELFKVKDKWTVEEISPYIELEINFNISSCKSSSEIDL